MSKLIFGWCTRRGTTWFPVGPIRVCNHIDSQYDPFGRDVCGLGFEMLCDMWAHRCKTTVMLKVVDVVKQHPSISKVSHNIPTGTSFALLMGYPRVSFRPITPYVLIQAMISATTQCAYIEQSIISGHYNLSP